MELPNYQVNLYLIKKNVGGIWTETKKGETLIKVELPIYQVTLYIYNFFCKGILGNHLERGDPYKRGNTKLPKYQTTKLSSPQKTFGTLSIEKET